ncbi:MAG: hypothetical protein ACNI27_09180 [Desulfovibrio sp.]
MAEFSRKDDVNISVEDQIRGLKDNELLDFWEETQQLLRLKEEGQEAQAGIEYDPEYERIILTELQLRSCMRTLK